MAAIIPFIPYIAGAVGAAGSIMGGQSASNAADYQARQLKMQANAAEASSQYQAEQDRREANIVNSRVRALSAADGGTSTDKGVLDIMGRITEHGEYKALADLWTGTEQANYYRDSASAASIEGQQAKSGSYLSAVGSLFKGVAGGMAQNKQPTIATDAQPSTLYSNYAQGWDLDPWGLSKRKDYVTQ